MKVSDTTVLNFLDLPPRILLWPVSEVIMVCSPCFVMMVFGHILIGIFCSILTMGLIKIFRRSFGQGYLHGVLYWYLPTSKDQFLITPPSYMRTFIN